MVLTVFTRNKTALSLAELTSIRMRWSKKVKASPLDSRIFSTVCVNWARSWFAVSCRRPNGIS